MTWPRFFKMGIRSPRPPLPYATAPEFGIRRVQSMGPFARRIEAAKYHDNVPDCDDSDAGFEHIPEAFKLLELFVQGVDGGYLVVDPDLASKKFLDEIVAKAKAVLAAERSKT